MGSLTEEVFECLMDNVKPEKILKSLLDNVQDRLSK